MISGGAVRESVKEGRQLAQLRLVRREKTVELLG